MRSICFVIRDLDCGGAQRQLLTLAQQLLARGYSVSLVTFYGGGALEAELKQMPGLRHICLHKRGRTETIPFLLRFLRALRELKPEVLHGYLYLANILCLFAANFLRPKPKVLWGLRSSNNHLEHYSALEKFCARLERGLSRLPDAIICNSQAGFHYARERGFPTARMQVIANGIDTQRFQRSQAERQRLRTLWGVPEQQRLIGIVGRPDPKKGHMLFLEAAALLSAKEGAVLLSAQESAVRFVVVGQGAEPFFSQLKAKAEDLGIAAQVLWVGMQQQMSAVYSALDVLTLCSNAAEGFPNVVGEAMACEVPCVVTPAGDAALVVADTGIVLTQTTAQALASAWLKLLGGDHRALGLAARQRMLQEFGVERLGARTAAVIEELFSGVAQKPLAATSAALGEESPARRLRLLVVVTGLDTGGAEMMLHKLLSRLDSARFEVLLVSLKAKGSLESRFRDSGIALQIVEFSPTRPSWRAFRQGVSLLRQYKPDLLLGWMYHACLITTLWKYAARSPAALLWSVRASAYKRHEIKRATRYVIALCAKFSRFARAVVYCSQVAQHQHEAQGFAAQKSIFIPNGFDLERFSPSDSSRATVRTKLGLSAEALLVAMIGRYDPQKDHACFLRAAAKVVQRLPQVRFVLAGRAVDPENPALMKLVRESGIEQNLLLLGERSDVPELLAASDLLVSSSSTGEGFPNVLGEAMASGLACVSTDVGDSRLVIGDCGIIVPPADAPALADAMLALLSMPEWERTQLGLRARQRVLEHFEIDAVVGQYQQLLLAAGGGALPGLADGVRIAA
jgi:glycosyltransferase involved in cell wall biosynthesis